jgi:predicted enzyme related to lactoylglutathione lyase
MDKIAVLKKISFKADREDFDRIKLVALSLLDAKIVYKEPGLCVFQLDAGITLEIYGIGASYPDYLFKNSNVSVSFKVDNLNTALLKLKDEGIQILTGIVKVCPSLFYCHIRLQNGTVIGLYQENYKKLS